MRTSDVPGVLNMPPLAGDEKVPLAPIGPRAAQADARKIAAAAYDVQETAGTTYTFELADAGGVYRRFTSDDPVTATVPPDSAVAWPDGCQLLIEAAGAGTVSVAEGDGVTINSPGSLDSNAQYGMLMLVKVGENEWTLGGNVAP